MAYASLAPTPPLFPPEEASASQMPNVGVTLEHNDLNLTEQALAKNYERFQKTLLQSVDRQVTRIQEKLNETDAVLKCAKDEKEEMGVALYKSKIEVDRANDKMAQQRGLNLRLEDEVHVLLAEKEAAEHEIRSVRNQNAQLLEELSKTKKLLDETTLKTSHLTDINSAYFSDIKIHKRIEGKLKKELEYIDERKRQAESDLEDQRKMSEKLQRSTTELELILDAQKHETVMATQTIAKMNKEINVLNSEKSAVQKQWEDAMTAMSKRDETFQHVNEQKEKVREQVAELSNINRAIKLEKEETEKKLRDTELENQNIMNQVQFLRSSLAVMENKQRDTRGALTEAQVAESLYKQELEKVSKQHNIAHDELQRKTTTVSELKTTLETMKAQFEEKLQNEIIMQVAKKEELVLAQTATQVTALRRDHEGKNIDLRHENAELRIKVHNLEETFKVHLEEKESLQRLFDEVNSHYNKLYEEAKHWMYNLERKEHDINYMRAIIQELNEVDKTRPYQIAIAKLQKDMESAKLENDNIQNMWLESQKENLKFKNEIVALKDDNVFLRTQLGISDTVKMKTAKEIEDSRTKTMEQKLETAKLYGELRKLKPLVDEYKDKLLSLEQQLLDAKAQLQEQNLNGATAASMLKTEIRRLHEDKKELNRSRMIDERSSQALERKYCVAKEMVEKLKSERKELQRLCFEYKTKAEDMEKRYFDAQIQARKMAEKAGQTVGEIALRLSGETPATKQGHILSSGAQTPVSNPNPNIINLLPIKLPPPVWASLATTPAAKSAASDHCNTENDGEPSPVMSPEPQQERPLTQEIPDFESWRLKIVSMTSERAYLVNDNTMLKAKVEELNQTVARLERSIAESQSRVKINERELKQAMYNAKVAAAKYAKAEQVAATIEKQFKEAKPNTRINYSFTLDAEPSTQLIAALMFRETDLAEFHVKDDKKDAVLASRRQSFAKMGMMAVYGGGRKSSLGF